MSRWASGVCASLDPILTTRFTGRLPLPFRSSELSLYEGFPYQITYVFLASTFAEQSSCLLMSGFPATQTLTCDVQRCGLLSWGTSLKLGRTCYIETQWRFMFVLWLPRLVGTFTQVCSNICDAMLFVFLLLSQKRMGRRLFLSICLHVWLCDTTDRTLKTWHNLFYNIIRKLVVVIELSCRMNLVWVHVCPM